MVFLLQKIDDSVLDDSAFLQTEYFSNNDSKSNFENFHRIQCQIEAAKYPFLTKTQIRQRILAMWKKKNGSHPK